MTKLSRAVGRIGRWRPMALALLPALLASCGGGGGGGANGGGNGGGNGGAQSASADGYVFGVSRQVATGQTPLAGMTVQAFGLPPGASPLATAPTDNRGRFAFGPATGNELPANRTLLLRATGSGRVVSGLLNTSVGITSKTLTEVTHLAALGLVAAGLAAVSNEQIALHEQAARAQLEAALSSSPDADYTLLAQQPAAARLGAAAHDAVTSGQVVTNRPPVLTNVTLTPTQLSHRGGRVGISCEVSDPDGDDVTVSALVYRTPGEAPEVITLTFEAGALRGGFDVAGNDGDTTILIQVAFVADDGISPSVPGSIRTISVLPDGRITLDILTETLFDEPATREAISRQLDRMRPVVRRGRTARTRQVNPNQSIRGAQVVVDDVSGLQGTTGNDGLLLLSVPLSAADDGVLVLTASIAGRASYRQFLYLPQSITLRDGDTIEVDLVLATAADWQELANAMDLGTLNFSRAPLTAFFNVLSDVTITGGTPTKTYFRLLGETARGDDGDFFAANLPATALQARGAYADPDSLVATLDFGPFEMDLTAGQVNSGAALIPPG